MAPLVLVVLACASAAQHAVFHRRQVDKAPLSERGASKEYKTKAIFLHNFILYTNWPTGTFKNVEDPYELLVVGKDPFQGSLKEAFAGKVLHQRKVIVRHSKSVPKKLNAQLVFAAELDQKQMTSLLLLCKRKGVLLIGDRRGLAQRGACADFYVSNSKVRFQVNAQELKLRGLKISSQLLKLAAIVKTTTKSDDRDQAQRGVK